MAVISKLIIDGEDVLKHEDASISSIVVDGEEFNFAENTEAIGTCENAVEEPIIDMQLSGNSVQQTYSGKNLFNSALWETETTQYGLTVQYLKDEDCFILNGTTTIETAFTLKYLNIPITKNEVFSLSSVYVSGTITKPTSGNNYSVAYFGMADEPNKYANWTNVVLSQSNYKRENQTCNANYISVFWFFLSAGITFDNYKVKIQLERGSTATDYEPYVGGESSPSPDYPQEIESVGDKTNNIADLSKVNTSTTTPNVTFNYDNKTGTVEYTSEPTAYDYLLLYLERDVGYKFEQGKTYYWGADVTVSGKTTTNATKLYFGISYDGSSQSGKVFNVEENTSFHISGSFIYEGQTNIRLVMHANYGSEEPALVKYEHIFVSEVNEFEPYGYKVPVKVCGKNLLNADVREYENTTFYGIQVTYNEDGSIHYEGTATNATSLFLTRKSFTLPAGTYTINNVNNTCRTYLLPNYIGGGTFTLKEDTTFTGVYVNIPNGSVLNDTLYPQLEKGTIATDFEPYIEPTITNIYLNEPLRKISDYADYIDYKNKKVVRNVGKVVYDENTTFGSITSSYWQSDGITKAFSINIPDNVVVNTYGSECLCNIFKFDSAKDGITNTKPYISGNANQWVFAFNVGIASTLEELKTFLNNTNMEVIYKLSTPIEETIDIPEISTSKGTNIFSTETTIQPSEIKINYWKQIGGV